MRRRHHTFHFSVFSFHLKKREDFPMGILSLSLYSKELFNCINNCLECLWLVKSKVSQNLTV